MENYFSQFGKVVKAFIIIDPVQRASKLFGYVEFVDVDTKDIVLAKKVHYLKGKKVLVEQYLPRLYCKNKHL